MKPRRAARRLLDPWAGLLFTALIVLGVVILLASPGPWHVVGEAEPPVTLVVDPPKDLAVFVFAGPASGRCTAVVWLHVTHEPTTLAATLIPVQTRAAVPGGGYAPIRRLATDVGPEAASDALGAVLGLGFDRWVTLDRAALLRLFTAARTQGDGRKGLLELEAGMTAFTRPARDLAALRAQDRTLARVLRALHYGSLTANAVVNYALGSADVGTDLDLRAASALVKALGALDTQDVVAGTAATIVERCGPASSWRLDASRLEQLRRSLALGLEPPVAAPAVATRERTAEVLLVAPAGPGAARLAGDLEAALREGGALPVKVRVAPLGAAATAGGFAATLAARRPIAVVLAPGAEQPGQEEETAGRLTALTNVLALTSQPGVIAGTVQWAVGDTARAIEASRLPFVELGGDGPSAPSSSTPGTGLGSDEARRQAARLVARVLVRSCWPDYLAPALAGTRLEFSYAARRAAEVTLADGAPPDVASLVASWGYGVRAGAGVAWAEPAEPAITFVPAARRAAVALAGDLGWRYGALGLEPAAPAELTLLGAPD